MAALPVAVAQNAQEAMKSVRDGVYTEEQARRGERINNETCVDCHMSDWFTETLLSSWAGAPVSALYDLIRTTMPQDSPGGLERQEYADVLAYIFELNGLPPGREELSAQADALGSILIERGQ